MNSEAREIKQFLLFYTLCSLTGLNTLSSNSSITLETLKPCFITLRLSTDAMYNPSRRYPLVVLNI